LAIRLKQVSLKSMSTTDGKTKLATDTLRRQADCTGPYVTQFKSEFEKMSFWVGDWDVTGTRDGSSLTNYYKSTNSSESVPFRLPAEVRGHSTTAAEFPGFVLLYGRKNGVPSGYVYLTSVHNYGLSGFLRFWQGCGTTSSSSYPIERSIGLGRNYWGLDENGNETEVSSDILRWGQWTSYSAGDISFDVWEQDYYCTGWSTTAQKKRAAVKLSGMFGQLIFTLF
jgi:hypothetical protein